MIGTGPDWTGLVLQGTTRVDGMSGYSRRDASYPALHTPFAYIFMDRRTGDVPVRMDR